MNHFLNVWKILQEIDQAKVFGTLPTGAGFVRPTTSPVETGGVAYDATAAALPRVESCEAIEVILCAESDAWVGAESVSCSFSGRAGFFWFMSPKLSLSYRLTCLGSMLVAFLFSASFLF